MAKAARKGPIRIGSVIRKGGVGKTTISALLAHDLVRRGFAVLVIDCDGQGNIGSALNETQKVERGTASLYFKGAQPVPAAVKKYPGLFLIASEEGDRDVPDTTTSIDTFRANVDRAAEACGADYVIFDTPPDFGFPTYSALAASDFCFSPMKVTVWSIQGAGDLSDFVRQVKNAHNPRLVNLGILVNLFNPRSASQIEALEHLRSTQPAGGVFKATIGARSPIEKMESEGLPVWKIAKGAARLAAKEVREALDELLTKMEKV